MSDSMCNDAIFGESRLLIEVESALRTFNSYESTFSYLSLVICAFGTIANIIHLRVLSSAAMRSVPINFILAMIAICDIGTMASYLSIMIHFRLSDPESMGRCDFLKSTYSYLWVSFVPVNAWLTNWLHHSALWLTVSLVIVRYLTLRKPTPNSPWMKVSRAAVVSVLVMIPMFVVCAPTYLMHDISEEHYSTVTNCSTYADQNSSEPSIRVYVVGYSAAAKSHKCLLFRTEMLLSALVFKLLPCVILIVYSWLLFGRLRAIREQRKRIIGQNTDMTPLVIGVGVVFVVTESPQGLISAASAISIDTIHHVFYQNTADAVDLLSLINAGLNLVLSITLAPAYRIAAKECITHDVKCIAERTALVVRPLTIVCQRLGLTSRGPLSNRTDPVSVKDSARSERTKSVNGTIQNGEQTKALLAGATDESSGTKHQSPPPRIVVESATNDHVNMDDVTWL